jgi:hypothetical protein
MKLNFQNWMMPINYAEGCDPSPGTRTTGSDTRRAGFALVVTIALLVLLAVIAVGLLQLGAVSLRASGQARLTSEARANARVALMMAVAQLQRELGPDQRISATAGLLDDEPGTPRLDGVAEPRWTGVWNAAESQVASGTLDRPSYDKPLAFRRWLVSGESAILESPESAKTGVSAASTTARLVGPGLRSEAQREVRVPIIGGLRSGFAWWTSDDGVKATLRPGEDHDSESVGEALLALRRANSDGHQLLDPRIPSRSDGLDARLVTLPSVEAARPVGDGQARVSSEMLHDLTTRSDALVVDVTSGGFRKCLNMRIDWLEAQTPFRRKREGTIGKLHSAAADYRICSWDQLRNYLAISRDGGMLTLDRSTGRPLIRTHKQGGFTGNDGEPEWNPNIGEDRFRIQPVLLKMGYVFSYATERLNPPPDPNKPFALRFYVYPMAVLWNPYNVDLEVPEYCVHGFCPLAFTIDGGAAGKTVVDLTRNSSAILFGFGPEGGGAQRPGKIVIPAGASRALYPQGVRWQQFPDEHRHPRFRAHYYFWAGIGGFNLGDANFGGVLKNLRGGGEVASFHSIPNAEILGAADDSLRIGVTPSAQGAHWTMGMAAAHTDWWGNNGPGADNAETQQKFGMTTSVGFKIEADGSTPQISLVPASEVPVRTFGQLEGRPTPLLYYECFRKAADEDLFPAKHHSFSVAGNPIHAQTGRDLGNTDAITPWFESAYTFRFEAVHSWFDVTKTFQLPPDRDDRIYFGASYSPQGQLNVVDQEILLSPIVSLAQLQHLPLFDYRPTYDPATASANTIWYRGDYGFHEGRVTQFPQNHAIGNSYASPGIPPDRLRQRGWRYRFNVEADHLRVDRSYIANALLWDSWFCSTIAEQGGPMLAGVTGKRGARQVAADFRGGAGALPNDAIKIMPGRNHDGLLDDLFDAKGKPTRDAHARIAESLRVEGGFNVNSVSETAWAHFLSGLLSRPMAVMESVSGKEAPGMVAPGDDAFLVSRFTMAGAPPAEREQGKQRDDRYWSGAREISEGQIRELAAAIVRQVKQRGPFLSLSEFVNRRLTADPDLAISGALQSALDDPQVSINAPFRSDTLDVNPVTRAGRPNYHFPEAAAGPRRQGIAGYVTQADLLQSIGPALMPRSDTFTIRALGEARDDAGKVLARAWCEAVVQREAEFVDPANPAGDSTDKLNPVNNRFGRRFGIVSFRWLAAEEVES